MKILTELRLIIKIALEYHLDFNSMLFLQIQHHE